ncbi:MAG TPA: PocR ligand-binding domain-containing protein [Anaerolineae bacterium]|nr:PocR ligand-binding domain-containing protein [Anaerolineae bacterium]
MSGTDVLLTVRQLEQLLKVDRITVYRMLSAGRLPGFKVGGQWRFSSRAIEDWLQDQQGGPETPAESRGEEAPSPSADALPKSCIRAIQEILGQALGVGAVTTGLDGAPLTPVANCNPFCALILRSAEGSRHCAASWRSWASEPERSQHTTVCHAGLRYAHGRVEVQGTLVAAVHAGQHLTTVASDAEWADRIDALAAVCGLDTSALRAALEHVPVLGREAEQRLARLVRKTALTISEIGEERTELVGRLRRIAEMTRL